ncbi:MAG: hypothetical protein LBT95_02160 [Treponema sp.]|jgi:hypothetical protein|nr:hypothetical protein [Treponema sp.]
MVALYGAAPKSHRKGGKRKRKMEKTYYYEGRVKSESNKWAALKTSVYHGAECVDLDGFTYHLIDEDRAAKYWATFDFEKEVGKAISKADANELADFIDLQDIKK